MFDCQASGRFQQTLHFVHKMLRPFLFRHNLVRAALTAKIKMPIHLHKDFLPGLPLLDFFAELQTGIGKMANVNNDQVIWAGRGNNGAGRFQIGGGIDIVTLHAQYEGAQMLHRTIAINKQNSSASVSSHGYLF